MGSMPKLEYLNLERNEIEELYLNECPKLKRLFVSYNKLKSVDVSGCPEIELRSPYYNPGEMESSKSITRLLPRTTA